MIVTALVPVYDFRDLSYDRTQKPFTLSTFPMRVSRRCISRASFPARRQWQAQLRGWSKGGDCAQVEGVRCNAAGFIVFLCALHAFPRPLPLPALPLPAPSFPTSSLPAPSLPAPSVPVPSPSAFPLFWAEI
ncbi:unnamed protein product [Closterium sp. Naga37s-1]|nr:unnamed protein product [Closterium sp. Naga37s-1]